ncbi:MAG: hypothetical protein UT05_C0006G0042 [Parcubacteria group bacterium GW2011_GWF2_38_76]|nr:MAG: hypothetical protein UT05_C0006G0042 [Parcubacteria group bacterium GW2011_GWF2_38_76]HBM45858.1 hypothetical protein [Patescibacteria group bacterium]
MKIKIVDTLIKFLVYPTVIFIKREKETKKERRDRLRTIKQLIKNFKDQKLKYPFGIKEMKKTTEQSKIISDANRGTNEILKRYGLPEFFIPDENIHIINKGWKKFCNFLGNNPKYIGFCYFFRQLIGLLWVENNIGLVRHVIFHEMVHFKSFRAMAHISTASKPRCGLRIGEMGLVFDEAITEELASLFSGKNIGAYIKEKVSVRILIDKIFDRNLDKFISESEVFEMFVRAKFTGRLWELARIIRKSFPDKKDVFRKLFWLKTDAHLKFVKSL